MDGSFPPEKKGTRLDSTGTAMCLTNWKHRVFFSFKGPHKARLPEMHRFFESCFFSVFQVEILTLFPGRFILAGQIIVTRYRRVVTLNGGLVRESPQNPLNSGLGIIVICPDIGYV